MIKIKLKSPRIYLRHTYRKMVKKFILVREHILCQDSTFGESKGTVEYPVQSENTDRDTTKKHTRQILY